MKLAIIVVLISFILVLTGGSALAANNPGHDTLYIEQQGDSELNGSLNVTTNVRITGNNTVSGL